ncbi:NAD(P)H-hydrate epimerase [Novosphingobium aquimarinum]|uniref:NAD(P)H-hydrate epimerase n=1 Tax=Novosphingobium aquimarinum TaxID=2682494 RepID=UPI0012EBC49C|nr:NAD(P)H-hydrate epimerase [Novosphingobium aquimarinum]
MQGSEQVLTVAQMRAAEQALIEAGSSVEALMDTAGRGAAEWIWRIAGRGRVTVLCGPGNNGGDGYVIAESLRTRGADVAVIAAMPPTSQAAEKARSAYRGDVLGPDAARSGEVFVDCLFGSGLTRALSAEHVQLLTSLVAGHGQSIAIDVPSGIDSDRGLALNEDLPTYDLTLALGAWKFAHMLMPAASMMGTLRFVPIGVEPVAGAASMISQPRIAAPDAQAHKYKRGLLAVVGGEMQGAAMLAAHAAQGAGAGYIKVFADSAARAPHDIVVDTGRLSDVLVDDRNTAVLVGPGLGRRGEARERLAIALGDPVPVVADADALVLLGPRSLAGREAPTIATPHEGELVALERAFDLDGTGSKPDRAVALAAASGMIVVAKGPDTLVAAPDGRLACAPRATSWLSTAGTGDVLAGVIASRAATGVDAFTAACEGVWLHGAAARLCPPAFSANQLAAAVPKALAACL